MSVFEYDKNQDNQKPFHASGMAENAAKRALQASGKFLPWQVVTISTDGRILD